jgi:hypothetical protein
LACISGTIGYTGGVTKTVKERRCNMTEIVKRIKSICGVIGQRIDVIVKEEIESIDKFYAQYRAFDDI